MIVPRVTKNLKLNRGNWTMRNATAANTGRFRMVLCTESAQIIEPDDELVQTHVSSNATIFYVMDIKCRLHLWSQVMHVNHCNYDRYHFIPMFVSVSSFEHYPTHRKVI